MRLLFILTLCFYVSQSFSQIIENEINEQVEYFKRNNRYLYVESKPDKIDFQDSIRVNFKSFDTLKIKTRGYNTNNFGKLYLLNTSNEIIDSISTDCGAHDFLTFSIYKENWKYGILELNSCHMKSIITILQ